MSMALPDWYVEMIVADRDHDAWVDAGLWYPRVTSTISFSMFASKLVRCSALSFRAGLG